MFTLEYADGYYIAKDGEGVIDFNDPEDFDFAEFVLLALNAAQPSVQRTGRCVSRLGTYTRHHFGRRDKCQRCGSPSR